MAEKLILVRNSIKRKFCWRMVEGELCSPGCFCIGKWRQRGICIFPGETTRRSTITTRKKYLYAQISYTMVLTLPFGLVAFVMICVFFFYHNFFVDRNQTWTPGRKPGLENVIEWDWCNPDTTGCEILCDRKRMYLSFKPWLPTLTMPFRRANRTFTLVNFLLSWAVFTRVSVGVYTSKIFT